MQLPYQQLLVWLRSVQRQLHRCRYQLQRRALSDFIRTPSARRGVLCDNFSRPIKCEPEECGDFVVAVLALPEPIGVRVADGILHGDAERLKHLLLLAEYQHDEQRHTRSLRFVNLLCQRQRHDYAQRSSVAVKLVDALTLIFNISDCHCVQQWKCYRKLLGQWQPLSECLTEFQRC